MIGALLIAQLAIVAHGPDTASACEAIEVSVAVSGPGRAAPVLVVPPLAPFDVLRSSTVPHMTFDAARGQFVAEYRYVLATERAGTFTIAPFEARLGGATVRSGAVTVSVRPPSTAGVVPTVVARARVDTSLDVDFRARTAPETVFVGQQANYEVAVFLNQAVRDRLRRNPTFFPPDMQSMLAYDFPARGEASSHLMGSHCFDALVYQRALFPLMAGRFAIPPAELVYSLPLSASFFSREESHELQTDSTVLVAVDPPQAGRPADYGGAVGDVRLAARLDTNASRVGDPIVLTVRVSGSGNVKLFPRPRVGVPWASLVNGDERVAVDSGTRRIAGSKEFDWVLTPRLAGELDVPPIHYSFFNPATRRYEVASTDAERVHVARGALASADTAMRQSLLSLRTRYRGDAGAPLHEHPTFWAILALLPLPALSLGARNRRRRASARPLTRAERLSLIAGGGVSANDPCEVRRAFVSALDERLNLGAEAFTRAGALARALRRRGVSRNTAQESEGFLRGLDAAAFAPDGVMPADAARQARVLFDAIDGEALSRWRIPTRAVAVVLAAGALSAATIGVLRAVQAADAERAFDAGVTAYRRHDFIAAREAFIDAATLAPRAPDAWANLGTAAWETADTARSVGGWQRALRYEPTASDVRERVELVHALPFTAAGYVPAIPAAWIFDVAALIWCVTWVIAGVRLWRDEIVSTRSIGFVSVVCAAMLVGGLVLAEHVAGRDLAVLRKTLALRENPQLGGETGTTGIIGEVVRVSGQQGTWSRVVLDDGRDGWVESRQLLPLDPRDATSFATEPGAD